jgi:hypothetical protein
MKGSEFESRSEKLFSSPDASRPSLGVTKPPVKWIPVFFLGWGGRVERPESDDYSSLFSVEVKIEQSCNSAPSLCLDVMYVTALPFYTSTKPHVVT